MYVCIQIYVQNLRTQIVWFILVLTTNPIHWRWWNCLENQIWWTQIGIHWHHYLKSRSDLRVFSNRCPFQILRSMADLLVRVRAYVSDVIVRRFEKVRNGHRFENWTPIWEFEKGHRSEGQMSVTLRHRNWTWI